MSALEGKSLAVIGAGRIGETLIQGLVDAQVIAPRRVIATARRPERLEALAARAHVEVSTDNAGSVARADVVLLCVKPQQVPEALATLGPSMTSAKLLVSVAAGVGTAFLERSLGGEVPVIRAMPNTPCQLKVGMTALSPGRHARAEHVAMARTIFESVGRCIVLEERHMDAVTGLSASGPAFIYIVIESLAEAGVKVGLPRGVATELAAQTVLGSATMVLHTGEHPALLKDQVTTPAGCTIDGILELEEGGLRVTLIKAVVKATQRASQLFSG